MADEPRKVLSKNLMKMKFMQRKAESDYRKQLEEERQREIDESHWVADNVDGDSEKSVIEVEPSYVFCEDLYTNGRMSFKNFNPAVEKMFKEMLTRDEEVQAEVKERENMISDEEMARRYETLVDTVGKKFTMKRKRGSEDHSIANSPAAVKPGKKMKREFMKPKD